MARSALTKCQWMKTPLYVPTNPYSVSKVTQDMMGLQYYLSHQLPIMRARAFNHIGPGQSTRFVAPSFATSDCQ